jgi:hypothetical protein
VTRCIEPQLRFEFQSQPTVRGRFDGGELSSDGGLLPLRQFDERHGLTRRLAARLGDRRQAAKVEHPLPTLLRQRIYQIIAGYEDANDAGRLRTDPIFRLVAGQGPEGPLGSQPTLSRWENGVRRRDLLAMGEELLEWFILACGAGVRRRKEILLDIDSTDDPTHGQQEFSFFHGAYNQHMYHPLVVTERHTGFALALWLRPGNAGSASGATRLLLRLLRRLRRAFPSARVRLRADAGFALPELYEFCEQMGVGYAIGIGTNPVLRRQAAGLQEAAQLAYQAAGHPQRLHAEFRYQARSWPHPRRICYKVEHTAAGANQRFLLTNGAEPASATFDFYNDRGECENRIEELKNGFAADRLSCHRFAANQLRLLLHAAAYNLVNLFRLRLPPRLRSLQIEGLRNQVFKLAARVRRTARCVRVSFAQGWPFQAEFLRLCRLFGSA